MSDEAKAEIEAGEDPMERAVLVEFDNIVLGGREVLYSSMKKVLAAKGVDLTPVAFSKYALKRPVLEALTAILSDAGKKASPEKIKADVDKALLAGLSAASANSGKDLKSLAKLANDQKVTVGLVSSLSEDLMGPILKKLGLADLADKVIQDTNGSPCPTTETWMKLAKHTSMAPVCCLAIVSCAVSCKAALGAGMRCIVIPDKYTCFQDFGGSSYVADTIGEVTKDMFELLETSR